MATKKGKSVTDWENAADSSTPTVFYRTLNVQGLEIFYSEAALETVDHLAPILTFYFVSTTWVAFSEGTYSTQR